MIRPLAYLLLVTAVMLCACATAPRKEAPAQQTVSGEQIAGEMFAADSGTARSLMDRGNYVEAVVEFRKLMDYAPDEAVRRRARLGLARCLMKMENHTGALKVLRPYPADPQTDYERRRLALAGEAFLRDGRPREAEILLEISLDGAGREEGASPWKAAVCANLGCAYLKNSKFAQAVMLYRRASSLYRAAGKVVAARETADMADSIQSLL